MALKSNREKKRFGRDNSEDAVTWNVFRYMERNGVLLPYLSSLVKISLQLKQVIFWSHDCTADIPWKPLMNARSVFELNPSKGSEPDLIVLTDRCLFFIESKVNAKNNTVPSSPNTEVKPKYISGGGDWWKSAFVPGTGYDQIAVTDKKYELMRFWLLGTWLANELDVDFRLVNLLREQDEDEADIAARFGKYLPEHSKNKFQRVTWGDIHGFINAQAPESADKVKMLAYFREKTVGYRDGELQRAFKV